MFQAAIRMSLQLHWLPSQPQHSQALFPLRPLSVNFSTAGTGDASFGSGGVCYFYTSRFISYLGSVSYMIVCEENNVKSFLSCRFCKQHIQFVQFFTKMYCFSYFFHFNYWACRRRSDWLWPRQRQQFSSESGDHEDHCSQSETASHLHAKRYNFLVLINALNFSLFSAVNHNSAGQLGRSASASNFVSMAAAGQRKYVRAAGGRFLLCESLCNNDFITNSLKKKHS